MGKTEDYQDLCSMQYHEAKVIDSEIIVLRVPGGWIYEINRRGNLSHVFVPFPALTSDII